MDGPDPHRRASDYPVDTRIAVLEVEVRSLKKIADKTTQLIEKLDQRADKTDVNMARLLAGLAVLTVIGQIVAPFVLDLFGLRAIVPVP